MSSGTDTAHILRVAGGEGEVIHPDECPVTVETVGDSFTDEPLTYTVYECAVGWEVASVGFDGLVDKDGNAVEIGQLPDGDYRLALDWYTPESWYEDADATFTLVGPA